MCHGKIMPASALLTALRLGPVPPGGQTERGPGETSGGPLSAAYRCRNSRSVGVVWTGCGAVRALRMVAWLEGALGAAPSVAQPLRPVPTQSPLEWLPGSLGNGRVPGAAVGEGDC